MWEWKLSNLLYFFLRANQEKIVSLANGGTQPNLSKELIENINIISSNNIILNKPPFIEVINFFGSIERENLQLQDLKNLILNKLITRV